MFKNTNLKPILKQNQKYCHWLAKFATVNGILTSTQQKQLC